MPGKVQRPEENHVSTNCRLVSEEEYMKKGGKGAWLEPRWMRRMRLVKQIIDGIHGRDVL